MGGLVLRVYLPSIWYKDRDVGASANPACPFLSMGSRMPSSLSSESAAMALLRARTTLQPIDELSADCRPTDLVAAYAVQGRLNRLLADTGFGPVVGAKIGCTTAVMQSYLGIPHPCAGALFAATVREGDAVFPRTAFRRPGVECEVAVELARDMVSDLPFTLASVAPFVAAARASIEIVDDRWTDFRKVSTPSLVADNFFNAGCVLGRAVTIDAAADAAAWSTVQGSLQINGADVGSGTGQDILGHPLEALAWLANHRQQAGAPLRAGEIVTLGSLVKTVWIGAGDTVTVTLSDLGTCSLRLT